MVKNKYKILNSDGKEAVDGLKTGYIDAGGSSVVLTGQRNGKRVVVVVLGSDGITNSKGKIVKRSSEVRDENAHRLMLDALGTVTW